MPIAFSADFGSGAFTTGRDQRAVENVHPLYHFNATILHLLGLDYERLTFEHNGIQRRLTNVEGEVIPEVLA